jgi:hypothetical protein
MDKACSPTEFELPTHLKFAMRRTALEAQEMTWDQLYYALLTLYQQRLLELQMIKGLMAQENIELEFDVPTDIELAQLALICADDSDDEEEELLPF